MSTNCIGTLYTEHFCGDDRTSSSISWEGSGRRSILGGRNRTAPFYIPCTTSRSQVTARSKRRRNDEPGVGSRLHRCQCAEPRRQDIASLGHLAGHGQGTSRQGASGLLLSFCGCPGQQWADSIFLTAVLDNYDAVGPSHRHGQSGCQRTIIWIRSGLTRVGSAIRICGLFIENHRKPHKTIKVAVEEGEASDQ